MHELSLDWECGNSIAVAKQIPSSLKLQTQLTALKLQPSKGCPEQGFNLGSLPPGLQALQLTGFSWVTAEPSTNPEPSAISTRLTQSELAVLSYSDPRLKSAGVDILGRQLYCPVVAIQATAALVVPLPIASTLRVLVISTPQLSYAVQRHCWPQLESLGLSFARIESWNPAQQAWHLTPGSFPQLQQLMFGSSDPIRATELISFSRQSAPLSPLINQLAPASVSRSEFHHEAMPDSCVSSCCSHLATFPSLRRVLALGPCWDMPGEMHVPQSCSVEVGACEAGYRGCSGVRCRFLLEHLSFSRHMVGSLTHLRLRLMHSVGIPAQDPRVLNLSPLGCCTQLRALVIAVEKGLQRAWSICGHGKLPSDASLRIDLCPVSLAPTIPEVSVDACPSRQIIILRLAGPPC